MRHGEAESNTQRIVSSSITASNSHGLTKQGLREAEQTGKRLTQESIEIVISSPFLRAKQTAEIVAVALGINPKQIITDERLKEIDTGVFDGKSIDEYRGYFPSMREKFTRRPKGGENLLEVKCRVMELFEELEEKYQNKTILFVSHEYPLWMITAGAEGAGVDRALEIKEGNEDFIKTGVVKEISFTRFPHNAEYEFDMHRPYIDSVPVVCSCGGGMARVPYVFDCWFESGSMPYAQFHYPFENKELFENNFPADFIGEGIDQTRGWFYNMLNLSVGLFGKAPFKNVLVNGFVLAEDGQKMSKRLKNYPDILDIINRYGADALRYYLLSSPVTRAEDLAFSEKGIDEVVKKVMMRLLNVLSFYELHKDKKGEFKNTKKNILDQWILARLAELGNGMTASLNAYELDHAIKPIGLFVDDLSTWYLRRSRDRFKSDDVDERTQAIETTRVVFLELAKLLAPIMPFIAEHIYMKVGGERESVHLDSWTVFNKPDQAVLLEMKEVRQIVSLALEIRAKEGIKVRQPIATLRLKMKNEKRKKELVDLIKDEVNVKEVVYDDAITGEVELDTVITQELKREGQFRELSRAVQELRKTRGLTPQNMAILEISTNEEGRALVDAFSAELKKISLLKDIIFKDVQGEPVDANGILFKIELSRNF